MGEGGRMTAVHSKGLQRLAAAVLVVAVRDAADMHPVHRFTRAAAIEWLTHPEGGLLYADLIGLNRGAIHAWVKGGCQRPAGWKRLRCACA
jgi:hypothetical protein